MFNSKAGRAHTHITKNTQTRTGRGAVHAGVMIWIVRRGTKHTQRNTMTSISMALLACPLQHKRRRRGCSDAWSTKQMSDARTGKVNTTRANITRNSGWNNVSVSRVISNSHRRLVKTARRPPVVQSKLRNAFLSLYSSFSSSLFSFSPLFSEQWLFCASLCAAHLYGGTLPLGVFGLIYLCLVW